MKNFRNLIPLPYCLKSLPITPLFSSIKLIPEEPDGVITITNNIFVPQGLKNPTDI